MESKHRNPHRLRTLSLLALGTTLGCSDGASTLTDENTNPGVDTGGTSSGGNSDVTGSGGDVTPGSGGLPGAGGQGSGGETTNGAGGALVSATCPGDASAAWQEPIPNIPGTIQAEDFDPDGYADDTAGNEDGAYRADVDVDIKELGDGYTISWFTSGEWLEFTVNVLEEGDYRVVAQVAATEASRTLELTSCGTLLGVIDVPVLSDWGSLASSAPITVHLTPGVQVLRVAVGAEDYVDFDSLSFELADPTSGDGGSGAGGTGSGGMGSGGDSAGGSGAGGSGAGGMGTGGSGQPELPKFVGNITTYNGIDANGLVFSDYWDQITPENAGKWGSVQGNISSARNWNTLTAIYDYAQSKGILFKQHVFVWGAQQPSGNITEADVKSWMNEFCTRFPNTPLIDVVNEPPPHTTPSYANAIGGGTNGSWQWIINAFIWAEEACPNSILILNDYNNIEYGDQNQHFINIAKTVKDAGAPIHAVGAQSHGLHGQFGASTQTMMNLVTKLHNDVGLPVYITEYDIGEANDQTQLNKYKEHMTFFLETEWIKGITLWGWINGATWIDNSGIVNGSTPRPAMTWLMDTLGRPVPGQ